MGIVKYPPPLHHYSWGVLNDNERKTALSELQELSKKQWHEDREKESGMVLPMVGGRIKSEDDPWEWRHWDKMYIVEKQKAFESLQVCFESSISLQGRLLTIFNRGERETVSEVSSSVSIKMLWPKLFL